MIDKILITPDITKTIDRNDYSSAAKYLFAQQYDNWEINRNSYDILRDVKVKSFRFGSYKIKVQFNPGRIISTSAKVDEKSIKERKCFLCVENLPAEQKGIVYDNKYIILVNPFPIFPEHFTLANLKHQPQRIADTFPYLLRFSRDLSKHYSVVYNGPKCGASAPDHLHFQAGSKGFMPMDDEFHLIKNEFGDELFSDDNILITGVDDGLRKFITMESLSYDLMINWFQKILDVLNSENPSEPESMMNIIADYDEEFGWQLAIFVREKHRPTHYFHEDESRILLSPASVDLAGCCITPDENSFEKINENTIREIFSEVFVDKQKFGKIISSLKSL
jgi:hypothetical protein